MKDQTPTPKVFEVKRFGIASNGDGYEVVDRKDGRPVTNAFFTANLPLQLAGMLNDAAEKGSTTLARALGAIEDEEVLDDETVTMLCLG